MDKTPIIIGGCPRSGTTLLRVMLNSHKNIYSGKEAGVTMTTGESAVNSWNQIGKRLYNEFGITDNDILKAYGKALEYLLETMLRINSDKPRIADKQPQSAQVFDSLSYMFPDSPIIHIIRDGRDVANSLLKTKMYENNTGKMMDFSKYAYKGAQYWRWIVVDRARKMLNHKNSKNYYELFYEDIVRNPERELRKLMEFIGEPWDENMLSFYEFNHEYEESMHPDIENPLKESNIGKWKDELTQQQMDEVHFEIGDSLKELGYS